MANTVQHKRGDTVAVNGYTGAVGEFIYNTTTKRIHAQDGATAGGIPHALVSDVDLKANASVTISAGTGLTGGGTLDANRTLALSSTSLASLALADSAVQSVNGKTGSSITLTKSDVGLSNVDNTSDDDKPISTATQAALNAKADSSITITAGSGLTGGGNLTANRTVALNAASIASLSKADTALQAPGGAAGQILAKNSGADNDVVWVTSEAATAVSYGSQTLTEAQKGQARANIGAQESLGFTPVRQYLNGTIHIGWTASKLSLKVDTTDFGTTWPIDITGGAGYAENSGNLGGKSRAAFDGDIGNRLIRDNATHAGFGSGDIEYPYMRHGNSGTGTVVRLLASGQLEGRLASQSVGTLGTYAFMSPNGSDVLVGPGGGWAGASLRYASATGTGIQISGVVPVGNWVCMGFCRSVNNSGATLWKRSS